MSWSLAVAVVLVVATAALGGLWYGRRAGKEAGGVARWMKWSTMLCFVAAIALAILWFSVGRGDNSDSGSADAKASPNPTPVVPVAISPIRLSNIQETITVYGTVVAQLGETEIISVPFEARIGRLFVTAGEQVQAGTPLLEIGPSSASQLELQHAKDTASSAQKELQQVQEQFDLRLATNSQILAARQSFQSAQRTLDTFERQGIGRSVKLTAQSAGIIRRVAAQQGQIVAAGAPLVENALENRIEVKLGIEPEDLPYVHDNAPVELFSVNTDTTPTTGHVRLITRQVNPATRLVDVFVAIPPNSPLMLEGYIRGKLVTTTKQALVVPNDAVLPEQTGYALFTVENGIAVKHIVHVGLQSSTEVEVEGDNLKAGMPVVTAGNYELTPGMAVSQEKPE